MRKNFEKINLKVKENKGSITLFVLLAVIFFVVILSGVYIASLNKQKSTVDSVDKIAKNYKVEDEELEGTYAKLESKSSVGGNVSDLSARVAELESIVGELQNQGSNVGDVLNSVYPVGSIYISTSNTNPSTLFGGTWEAFGQGRTLVGAGTGNDGTTNKTFTANATGGEYNHTLIEEQLPYIYGEIATAVVAGHDIRGIKGNAYGSVFSDLAFSTTYTGIAGTAITSGTQWGYGFRFGNNQSHNNIQPYIVTYMWKRTS